MGLLQTVWGYVAPQNILILALMVYAVSILVNRLDRRRRMARLGGSATVAKTWAPFGLDLVFGVLQAVKRHESLTFWRERLFQYQTVWTTTATLGNKDYIFTADPENVKAILATQFAEFDKGEQFHKQWKDFLGDSIFTTDGAMWHNSRQMIRPQFTRDRVSDLECFESHIGTLFKAIANGGALHGEDHIVDMNSANGKVIDISDLFFRYTLDVITEFLLGADIKSMTTPHNEFAEAFSEVQRVQNIFARAEKLRPFINSGGFWPGLKVIDRIINTYIDRALSLSSTELAAKTKSDKDFTFLHELVNFTRDRKVLRDQIISVLLAGRDTTASTLSWAFFELSRKPACVAKLRAEIMTVVGRSRTPTYDNLKNMPYLKAVLNETLRLYPSVPFNLRCATRDTTLPRGGGSDGTQPIGVLKDCFVIYSPLVMQRRADLYPPVSETFADVSVFSPERWMNWYPRPHDYIPFNSGPRICIGQQFALTEMSYVLTRLFQKFARVESRMDVVGRVEPMLKSDIVLSPGDGVYVSLWEDKK